MSDICDNRKLSVNRACDLPNGDFCDPRENGGMATQDDYRSWLARGLAKPGLKKVRLAESLGIDPSGVTRMLDGTRRIALEEVPKIAAYIGEVPPQTAGAHLDSEDVLPPDEDRSSAGVPVVGYVIAGESADYRPVSEAVNDLVDPPSWAGPETVALRVRGDSMGEWLDKWLVFFDDVRSPVTPDLMNRLCVVEIADGRRVLKILTKGTKRGRYTLLSDRNLTPPIENVELRWAAKVKGFYSP